MNTVSSTTLYPGKTYYYGVAIVDIESGIVDAGTDCDGNELIFDLDDMREEPV